MVRDARPADTRHDGAPLDALREQREEILDIAARCGVRNVRVFGSVARQEATHGSDVDLLVDLDPGRSLLDLGAFQMDVQELLGRQVDVVTAAALRERLRNKVTDDAVPL